MAKRVIIAVVLLALTASIFNEYGILSNAKSTGLAVHSVGMHSCYYLDRLDGYLKTKRDLFIIIKKPESASTESGIKDYPDNRKLLYLYFKNSKPIEVIYDQNFTELEINSKLYAIHSGAIYLIADNQVFMSSVRTNDLKYCRDSQNTDFTKEEFDAVVNGCSLMKPIRNNSKTDTIQVDNTESK